MAMIHIQEADFEPGAALARMTQNRADIGAVVSFLGLVRDMHKNEQVYAMTLEHYPAMTKKMIESIVDQAQTQWNIGDALVIHRFGRLLPSDQIVFICVSSPHRGEAFKACEFIIDQLKTKAPFWKKEETKNGNHWVEAKGSDFEKSAHWSGKK